MPFLIAILAPVFAAIGTVITTVGAIGSFAGAALGGALGLSGAGILALSTIGSTLALTGLAVGVLSGLQALAGLIFPQHSKINGNAVTFKADPSAGIPYVIGRMGVGGNIVFVDTSNDGHNKWLHYFTVLSHGPVDAIEGFSANNVPVSFNANGTVYKLGLNWRGDWNSGAQYNVNDGVAYSGSIYICVALSLGYAPSNIFYWAPAGTYAGPKWSTTMWQMQTRGLQPDTVLSAPANTGSVPEWTAANGLSGLCHTRWVLQYDVGAYATGTPKPIWTVRGPPIYDPRQDSTYPGGSGTQRANDPTTWSWSRNPFLHALTWLLGITNNGIRVLGVGAAITAIDVPAFVAGANVADANGWSCGGQVFSTDSKWDVFTQMLAAGGGFPTRKGAAISCIVETPRVSIATLTGADFVGPVNVQAIVARKDRINQVVPTYVSETHQWQGVQATPVKVAAYVTADGTVRSKGVQMTLVQSVNQAAQLSRYLIEDSREFGPITGPLKPQWMGLNPGDCITINEPEFGLNGQTILILDRRVDPATGCPTITARSETGAKHAFALGQTGVPPPPPDLTGVNLVAPAPNSPPWQAAGATLTNGGVAMPAIVVTGLMESVAASNLVIRTRQSTGPGPWTHYDSPPAAVATRVEITGVGSGETRDIGLSYLVRGIQGAELVLSNITAGSFLGSGAGSVVTPTAIEWADMTASGAGTQTATTGAQTFAAITVPVTLVMNFTGSGTFAYSKNGGAWTSFVTGATLVAAAGDTLNFQASANATASGVLTITNSTDSGATVDAPAYALTVTGANQTPSPTPIWGSIYETTYAGDPCNGYTGATAVQGISSAITLGVTFTGTGASLSYSINGGSYTAIASGGSIPTVNPNDTINFQFLNSGSGSASGTVTVSNTSTGGGAISTWTYRVTVKPGPWP